MNIISIIENDKFLKEYIEYCNLEWGTKHLTEELIEEKKEKILSQDKVISVLGLIENNQMIGFISLFKYDGLERQELTPWYATMYVKEEYRKKGYSKLLNDAILNETANLGYDKLYLKTNLVNYYEKFGAKFLEKLKNGENLYYIDIERQKE